MPDFCRSCKAPIVWALTLKGKRAPIDAEPDPLGNVHLYKDNGDDRQRCATLAGPILEEARADNEMALHLNHFVTCPEAAKHR